MCKKIMAVILSLALLLGCAAAVAEEPQAVSEKTKLGTISINGAFTLKVGIPEGYTLTPLVMNRDQVLSLFTSEDPEAPIMQLSVAFDESFADVERMNDLTQEDRELLELSYTVMDPTVVIEYGQTGLGTELLIARQETGDQHYIDFLSIYKGYFVEFAMVAAATATDKTLTPEQMRLCIDFLTDLDFVEAGEEDVLAQDRAGQTLTVMIRDYDAATGKLSLAVRKPVKLAAETVEGITEGDTLVIGTETVEVETVETLEDGSYSINSVYTLTKQEDGEYTAADYDMILMEDAESLTLDLPATAEFVDEIDPESLEMILEPETLTATDFTEKFRAEKEGMGPGFAADNVQVTFDADGNIARIVRIYVPWQ